VIPILAPVLDVQPPSASFYLWPDVAGDDAQFARDLYATENVIVLTGLLISVAMPARVIPVQGACAYRSLLRCPTASRPPTEFVVYGIEKLMTHALQTTIEGFWEVRGDISPTNAPTELVQTTEAVLELLDKGDARVASRGDTGQWTVHEWLKKSVLLYFRTHEIQLMVVIPRVGSTKSR
jgi:hypothetical protein